MRDDLRKETWLTAAQCAKRIGLTVRALRLYEQTGLIRPRRTGKNWRLYGANEIARLNEILTLKRLGLSLQHIAQLLAGQATDLDRMLRVQNRALQEQLARTQHSLAIVDVLRAKIAAGSFLSVDELLKLAKDTNMSDTSSDAIAWRRYEQARPRTEQKIDPVLYAEYEGFYRLEGLVYVFALKDGQLFSRLPGQPELEVFPEAIDRFFYKTVPAQLTFTRNGEGTVSGLILHQNGHDQAAARIDKSVGLALEEVLAHRISENRPVENGAALLSEVIEDLRCEPSYKMMTASLRDVAREQSAEIETNLKRMGALKDLTFKKVTKEGWDLYDVSFENGKLWWSFVLEEGGSFSGLFYRPPPEL